MTELAKISPLLLILVATNSLANDSRVDLLWKARGLQALEKLEKLSKKNGDSKEKNLSKADLCQQKLENAFVAFAKPETSTFVRQNIKGTEVFKMFFFQKNKEYTQINVNYSLKNKENEPAEIDVLKIADESFLVLTPKYSELIALRGDGCIFSIPKNDPLAAMGVPDKE